MSVGGATLVIDPSGSASRAEFLGGIEAPGRRPRLCGRERRREADVDDLGGADGTRRWSPGASRMRRAVWDQLVGLAEELSQQRKAEVLPADVAVVALEAGLAEVRRGATKPSKSASLARTPVLTRSQATGRGEKAKSGSASRSRSAARTTAAARSQGANRPAGASGSSSRNVRRPGPPLELTNEERAEVAAIVADVDSRARQRTIALWLGHAKKKIALEWLRELQHHARGLQRGQLRAEHEEGRRPLRGGQGRRGRPPRLAPDEGGRGPGQGPPQSCSPPPAPSTVDFVPLRETRTWSGKDVVERGAVRLRARRTRTGQARTIRPSGPDPGSDGQPQVEPARAVVVLDVVEAGEQRLEPRRRVLAGGLHDLDYRPRPRPRGRRAVARASGARRRAGSPGRGGGGRVGPCGPETPQRRGMTTSGAKDKAIITWGLWPDRRRSRADSRRTAWTWSSWPGASTGSRRWRRSCARSTG